MKADLGQIKEFNGWEHWTFVFKCAVNDPSSKNFRIFAATEMGIQEVSFEEEQTLTEVDGEQIDRMKSNSYIDLVHVMNHGAFLVARR